MYAANFHIHRIVKHASSFLKKSYWRLCLFDVYAPNLYEVTQGIVKETGATQSDKKKSDCLKLLFFLRTRDHANTC